MSARVLAKMSYRAEPEGVLAVVEVPERELPPEASLLLVAVGIEKPGNLGAMARTADAAGADALLVADARPTPGTRTRSVRRPARCSRCRSSRSTLDDVRDARPCTGVAAVLGAPTRHTDADLTSPIAFLVGAEDEGLDAALARRRRSRGGDPACAPAATDSLNAATRAAVAPLRGAAPAWL